MGKVPVKPNFIKEYDAEKELQQSIADKEQKKAQKEKAKNDQPANKISKKLLIPIITGVLLLFIVGGAFVLNSKTNIFNNKQKNKSASQVSDISKQVAEEKENSGDGIYQKEADALWNKYSDQFICNKNIFEDKYLSYRNKSMEIEDAFNEVYNEYASLTPDIEQEKETESVNGIKVNHIPVKDKSELTDIKKEEQDFILIEDHANCVNGKQ